MTLTAVGGGGAGRGGPRNVWERRRARRSDRQHGGVMEKRVDRRMEEQRAARTVATLVKECQKNDTRLLKKLQLINPFPRLYCND